MQLDQVNILEKSPLGVVVVDAEQRIVWCNERFLVDAKLEAKKVVGQLLAALPMEAIDKETHIVQQFNESNTPSQKYQYWQSETDTPAGGTIHYFTLERDANSKLNKYNISKLPKRPNWVEFLDYEVSRSRRYDNPLCVLKLHIIINHKPQELEGDEIRQTIRDTLLDELRWADMIGNTSRGSFLMVLPETPNSALEKLKTKISSAVQGQIKSLSESIDCQIVFGSAYWQKHDDSARLLRRARENLVSELEQNLKSNK